MRQKPLIFRIVDPNDARVYAGFLSDLNMMPTPGGRERTGMEYRRPRVAVGLHLNRVVHGSSVSHIVEAERIRIQRERPVQA